MKLATTTGDFNLYTDSKFEAIEYISRAGFKYIDYDFGKDYSCQNGIFSSDPEGYIEALLKKAGELGVTFVQSHAPMGAPIAKGEGYQPFIEANIRCIEACAKLGIDNIVVHSGYEKEISKEECFARNKEFYEALLPTAQRCGVYILTENFNKMWSPEIFWVDNAVDLKELADHIDHPMLKCCWDAGHGNLQDMPQNEALSLLGDRVYALHIQDNWGDDDYHVAPFFGTLNIDDLMAGLRAIDFKGYFTFEACSMLLNPSRRREFKEDTRLLKAPLELRIKAEALLYEIGKTILSAYGCFEE